MEWINLAQNDIKRGYVTLFTLVQCQSYFCEFSNCHRDKYKNYNLLEYCAVWLLLPSSGRALTGVINRSETSVFFY
jgi:hypothetical protein